MGRPIETREQTNHIGSFESLPGEGTLIMHGWVRIRRFIEGVIHCVDNICGESASIFVTRNGGGGELYPY